MIQLGADLHELALTEQVEITNQMLDRVAVVKQLLNEIQEPKIGLWVTERCKPHLPIQSKIIARGEK
jgi:hypothetical protein